MSEILELKNIKQYFYQGKNKINVLEKSRFDFYKVLRRLQLWDRLDLEKQAF